MRVSVVGLWHLGTVTAACLAASGHDVTGLDFDAGRVSGLTAGRPPLFEPGLEEAVSNGVAGGRLRFTTDPAALKDARVVWIAFDTPIDEDDRGDVETVIERTSRVFPHLANGAVVLVSSQVPVGTTRRIEHAFAEVAEGRRVGFAYSPENLQLGAALARFMHPDGIVVGVRSAGDRETLDELLGPLGSTVEWTTVESAEMIKHARNAFLATSIAFINEIARLCELVGADGGEVERGLKMDPRIGPKAYLSPGRAFAGGTLARDLVFLSELGARVGVPTKLISSVKTSNDAHRDWARDRIRHAFGSLAGKRVAIWGLTYKPGTNTLRRSDAVALCRWLHEHGADVRAHDPSIHDLPPELAGQGLLAASALDAAHAASVLVVETPWPEYRKIAAGDLVARMERPLVLDANRFLLDTLGRDIRVEYVSVGTAADRVPTP
jgi:UDPglucose 6-dehydrogenase